jgi:hypothetical protein
LLNRLSTSPWQSLQSRNFSTIHAASPAGESAKLAAMVSWRAFPAPAYPIVPSHWPSNQR